MRWVNVALLSAVVLLAVLLIYAVSSAFGLPHALAYGMSAAFCGAVRRYVEVLTAFAEGR